MLCCRGVYFPEVPDFENLPKTHLNRQTFLKERPGTMCCCLYHATSHLGSRHLRIDIEFTELFPPKAFIVILFTVAFHLSVNVSYTCHI